MEIYNQKPGIRVGDYIIRKDGSCSRATYDWGDRIQDGGHMQGRFYLGNGYLSYSGSLNNAILKSKLVDTGRKEVGAVWFFSENIQKAHNSVSFYPYFRVFKEIDE